MMRFDNIFFFSIGISFIIHFVFINFIIEKQIDKEKIVIFDLAQFREFVPAQVPNNIKKKAEKNKVNEKFQEEKKLKENKKIEREKVSKIKDSKKKAPIAEEKKKLEEDTKRNEVEKKKKSADNNIQNGVQRNVTNSKQLIQIDKNQKRINDELLFVYLKKFSEFLNIKAINSYPKQSKKRREEGTILTQINIDSEGNIVDFAILTQKPKRLANATENVIKKVKNFEKPPKHLFLKKKTFLVEIKINFRIY